MGIGEHITGSLYSNGPALNNIFKSNFFINLEDFTLKKNITVNITSNNKPLLKIIKNNIGYYHPNNILDALFKLNNTQKTIRIIDKNKQHHILYTLKENLFIKSIFERISNHIKINKIKTIKITTLNNNIISSKSFIFTYFNFSKIIKYNTLHIKTNNVLFVAKNNNIINNKKFYINKIKFNLHISKNVVLDFEKLKNTFSNKLISNIKIKGVLQLKQLTNFNIKSIRYTDTNDLKKYIFKESEYKLIIKYRKMNKVIYPKTRIPISKKI